jgi:hypothetical protein
MISNFNSWNISFNDKYKESEKKITDLLISYINLNINSTFLLNVNKVLFSSVEKIVYDIAMFHFKRLDIDFDENIHHIEFWFKKGNRKKDLDLHLDCDEYERIKINNLKYNVPILSCLLYLSDINIPTIITNLTSSIIPEKREFCLSFPKYLKHISFCGGINYHGCYNLFEKPIESRYILAINLWNIRPLLVPYYNNDMHYYMASIHLKENIIIPKTEVPKTEELIDISICNKNIKTVSIKKIYEEDFSNQLLNKFFLEDVKSCIVRINENIYDNIFLSIEQIKVLKYIKEHVCEEEICNWIISKLDLQTNREVRINIEPIDEIFNFLINIFGNNLKNILNKFLDCDINYNINIIDFYIELISKEEKLNNKNDESEITAILCLRDKKKDESGIDFFEKIEKMTSGDLIIFDSDRKYKFVNNDQQYYLFIKIKILKQ